MNYMHRVCIDKAHKTHFQYFNTDSPIAWKMDLPVTLKYLYYDLVGLNEMT